MSVRSPIVPSRPTLRAAMVSTLSSMTGHNQLCDIISQCSLLRYYTHSLEFDTVFSFDSHPLSNESSESVAQQRPPAPICITLSLDRTRNFQSAQPCQHPARIKISRQSQQMVSILRSISGLRVSRMKREKERK